MNRPAQSVETLLETVAKTTKNKDKLLQYRRILTAMLTYDTAASDPTVKVLMDELRNEKSPLLLKFIAGELLNTMRDVRVEQRDTITYATYAVRRGQPIAQTFKPTMAIAMMENADKLHAHLLVPLLFAICSHENVDPAELAAVERIIQNSLSLAVAKGTLAFNPKGTPVQIQEADGKPTTTPVFTVLNQTSRDLYTAEMSYHHQVVSALYAFIALHDVFGTLCWTHLQVGRTL